jgi:chloramphenicol-sensitive protein RarD
MADARRGYLFGAAAYLSWGLFPLYWGLLLPSGALEILAHRIVWSCLAVALVVSFARGWRRIGRLTRAPGKLGLIGLAAAIIAINWGLYIYGVNAERVVETSLGYFINPLVTVLLGVVVLRERLRPAQWAAVGVGAVAVAVLTVDYGHVPYLALSLAGTFALYGLIKKRLALPAADGLLVESAALAIPALVFLAWLGARGEASVGQVSPAHTALIMASGVITAIPLLLFAGAANRIPLSAIGLLQYLAPSLQLGCAVLILAEPLPPVRLAGFALVWCALVVFAWDGVASARARARTISKAGEPAPVPV